jgi:hypothetical protein
VACALFITVLRPHGHVTRNDRVHRAGDLGAHSLDDDSNFVPPPPSAAAFRPHVSEREREDRLDATHFNTPESLALQDASQEVVLSLSLSLSLRFDFTR